MEILTEEQKAAEARRQGHWKAVVAQQQEAVILRRKLEQNRSTELQT